MKYTSESSAFAREAERGEGLAVNRSEAQSGASRRRNEGVGILESTRSVTNNRNENQYELVVEGQKALAAYRLRDGRISFTHTEVPDALAGRGIGTALIEGALADVRAQGLKVVPICSFVRHYIETHPEAQDLLA